MQERLLSRIALTCCEPDERALLHGWALDADFGFTTASCG
jgi:hypothetical protein